MKLDPIEAAITFAFRVQDALQEMRRYDTLRPVVARLETEIDTMRNVIRDAGAEYKKACELMIARGDAQTRKHAMRAITDKKEALRQLNFNMGAERFLMEDTTEEERALIARFVRNLDEVRAG